MTYFARELETLRTDYNVVQVMECEDGTIDFDVVGATHATWHPRNLLTGHAWDAITAAAMMSPSPPESLLLLGLGGGTVLRQLRFFLPTTRMTAVDIDSGMIHLARKYMEIDRLNVDVIEADAFEFLKKNRLRYDVIIDDLYRCGKDDVERPSAVDYNTLACTGERLNPGGLLITNFVLGSGHHCIHQGARKAYIQFFDHVRAIQPPLSHNEVLVGTRNSLGLRSPRDLKSNWRLFPSPSDQKRWKELRNLKLR